MVRWAARPDRTAGTEWNLKKIARASHSDVPIASPECGLCLTWPVETEFALVRAPFPLAAGHAP